MQNRAIGIVDDDVRRIERPREFSEIADGARFGHAIAIPELRNGGAVQFPAGTLFYVPPGPPGHDNWVGDDTYVSLHFLGTEDYANK